MTSKFLDMSVISYDEPTSPIPKSSPTLRTLREASRGVFDEGKLIKCVCLALRLSACVILTWPQDYR